MKPGCYSNQERISEWLSDIRRKPQIKIQGCRVLVRAPEKPHLPHLAEGDLTFVEYGPCKIIIPQTSEHQTQRKLSEWEIVALGTVGRAPKKGSKFKSKLSFARNIPVPSELQVGQHVLVDHTMGFQAYEYQGEVMRIYSAEDIEAILALAQD